MSNLQNLHYASGCYALLVIFQAMDAVGKDGATAELTWKFNGRLKTSVRWRTDWFTGKVNNNFTN